MKTHKWSLLVAMIVVSLVQTDAQVSMKITKRYLNFPISQKTERAVMAIQCKGKADYSFSVRLASDKADYWTFYDALPLKGKTITITYKGNQEGLKNIYQSEEIVGIDSMYKEVNRPQFHFTPRRGWNNDPNGLIYYEGEYHLFYQHNPYEREWGNMHWGHAVSKDLMHWEELPEALYPDHIGTMFSGSAVIDYENTSGFGKEGVPPMVVIYTADNPEKELQCVAYSLDKGRTWTKYANNPVIDSKAKWNCKDTRDPKVFWHKPSGQWVMVLYERDGNSIYTSPNLKDWTYQSHITGFYECPDLFELPVDGSKSNTKWVMFGASGNYMIGSFDGKTFMPESGKYYYATGSMYAAQTYSNIPEADRRRILIGWGRIQHPDMPINGMMLLPVELTLKMTKEGTRLFSYPVKEFESLKNHVGCWNNLTLEQANEALKPYSENSCLHIRTTIKLWDSINAGLLLSGQPLIDYDMNYNRVNGIFYTPEDRTSLELTADIILDKTSVEVFIDGGAYAFSMLRKAVDGNKDGFCFFGRNIEVKTLEVSTINSIWK